MSERRARSAPLAAAIAALAAACTIGSEPIHVVTVHLAAGTPSAALGETGLDAAGIEEAMRAALGGAGFKLGEGARPHAAGVDITSLRVAPGGASGPRAEVTVDVVLTPVTPGNIAPRRETATGSAPLSLYTTPREAWRSALGDAAQRAAEGLALGVRAEGKGVDALVADLESKDPRVRDQAVRVLGERKSRAAVPALLARLKEEDPRIAHRIVGALAQIGDERAVPALIDLSSASDPVLTSRLARFVGDIGGPEAEGYLQTLASGHPDPRVRAAAQEALDDLTSRAKPAAAGAAAPATSAR
jgi:hypothetical protein